MLRQSRSLHRAARHVLSTGSQRLHGTSSESLPKSLLLNHPAAGKTPPQSALDIAERKEFATNAAAKILSSPLRMCQITRTRLPNDLLIPFVVAAHPTLPQDWVMPDFGRKTRMQRRYVVNSRSVLGTLSSGAWKKIQFPIHEVQKHGVGRRRVWRPDMIACVERDMARHAPHLTLND